VSDDSGSKTLVSVHISSFPRRPIADAPWNDSHLCRQLVSDKARGVAKAAVWFQADGFGSDQPRSTT
jgi:hypothetical protein